MTVSLRLVNPYFINMDTWAINEIGCFANLDQRELQSSKTTTEILLKGGETRLCKFKGKYIHAFI